MGAKWKFPALGGVNYHGQVDASAPKGSNGRVLLDPKDIIIDDSVASGGLFAFDLLEPTGFGVDGLFGETTISLAGNVLITNPLNDTAAPDAGAVFLFDGSNGTLVSTLLGSSSNDQIGNGGVGFIGGGDENTRYLIHSPDWDGGVGALTWMNFDGQLSNSSQGGTVNSGNSLIGAFTGDLSSYEVFNASPGRSFIRSGNWGGGKGAVTFIVGNSGLLSGGQAGAVISSGNSLVGTLSSDGIGSNGIQYIGNNGFEDIFGVLSPSWNGDRGALTWISGDTGMLYNLANLDFDFGGAVIDNAVNSFVGANPGDQVGYSNNAGGVIIFPDWLSNTALLTSSEFNNVRGAVTNLDVNASALLTGIISSASSLVGSSDGDWIGSSGVYRIGDTLFVLSPFWDDTINSLTDTGAITILDTSATGFLTGTVGTVNSLVGSSNNDKVGLNSSIANSGDYLGVLSSSWDNTNLLRTDTGAVTIFSNTYSANSVLIGNTVSGSNSWIGQSSGDKIGSGGNFSLNAGLLLVSPDWDASLSITDVGAVTLVDWATPTGVVTGSSSLTGLNAGDRIGSSGYDQDNNSGNILILSSDWDLGKGAVTWINGASGNMSNGSALAGQTVSVLNSLVGTTIGDMSLVDSYKYSGIFGDYFLIANRRWDDGPTTNVGAVTWMEASTGRLYDGAVFLINGGEISAVNSLVGSQAGDQVGRGGVNTDNFNSLAILSPNWDNGPLVDAGAVSLAIGSVLTGVVGGINSLVGEQAGDLVGSGGVVSSGGFVFVFSPGWAGGRGLVTMVDTVISGASMGGVSSVVTGRSFISGSIATDRVGSGGIVLGNFGGGIILSPDWDDTINSLADVGAITYFSAIMPLPNADVDSSNSVVGGFSGDMLGFGDESAGAQYVDSGDYFLISSPFWNGKRGAVTWMSPGDPLSLSGVVDGLSDSYNIFGGAPNSGLSTFIEVDYQNNGNHFYASFGAEISGGRSGHVRAGRGAGPSGGSPGNVGDAFFAFDPSGIMYLTSAQITALTNAGTDVVLQANNDITLELGTDIITNASGIGGNITFIAGRSILLNGRIVTDNGDLFLIANELAGNGVDDFNRVAGQAVITMGLGSELNTGDGQLSITMLLGDDKTNYETGAITLGLIRSGDLTVLHQGLQGATTTSAASENLIVLDGDTDAAAIILKGYDVKIKKLIEADSMMVNIQNYFIQDDLGDIRLSGTFELDDGMLGTGTALIGGGTFGDGRATIETETGNIDIQISAALNGDWELRSTNGGDITLSGVSGGWALSSKTDGAITLNGAIGGTALSSLELDGGTTDVNSDFVNAGEIDLTASGLLFINDFVDFDSTSGPSNIYGIRMEAASFTFVGSNTFTTNSDQGVGIRSTSGDVNASGVALRTGALAFEGPGNFDFTNASNELGIIATGSNGVGGDINLYDLNGITIGELPSPDEMAPSGTMIQDLRAGGLITIGSGGNVLVNSAIQSLGNTNITAAGKIDFSGGGSLKAQDAALVSFGDLVVGSSQIVGTLSLTQNATAANSITQSGAINVTTLTAFTLGSIELANAGNKIGFLSNVTASSGSINVFEDPGMTVNGTIYAGGNVTIGSYEGDLLIETTIVSFGTITLYTNFGNNVNTLAGSLSGLNYVIYSTTQDFLSNLMFDTTINSALFPAPGILAGENTLVLISASTGAPNLDNKNTKPNTNDLSQNDLFSDKDGEGNLQGAGIILTAYGVEEGDFIDNEDGFVGLDNFGNTTQIRDPLIIAKLREALGDKAWKDLLLALGLTEEEYGSDGGVPITVGETFDMSNLSLGTLDNAPQALKDALSDKAKAELEAILAGILENTGTLDGVTVTIGQVVDMQGNPIPNMPSVLVVALGPAAKRGLEDALK